jgi:ABC-type thiamin/hydroxymethylpyrimidine transport system permease subunit
MAKDRMPSLLLLSQVVHGRLTDSEDIHLGGLWLTAAVLCYRLFVARVGVAVVVWS